MNRIGLLVACAAVLGGCGGASYDDFTGNWAGVLNATYTCSDQNTIQVVFTSEQYNISQSGPNDNIAVAFCGNLVITGTADGSVLSVTPSGDISSACTQGDNAGNTITINDFAGGTFTYDGANLDASLSEDVTLVDSSGNSVTCSGTAQGTLSPS